MSYNAWLYVFSNPINKTDPSGRCEDIDGDGRCEGGYPSSRSVYSPFAKFVKENNAPDWNTQEQASIVSVLWDIAQAYASTYNQEMARRYSLYSCGSNWRLANPYFQTMSPSAAFLKIHSGPVTFNRSAENCTDCWAKSADKNVIWIFRNTTTDNLVRSSQIIAHEMGHNFDRIVGGKGKTSITSALWSRTIQGEKYGGFAGSRNKAEWQFSAGEGYDTSANIDGRGEIFADMFVGWVYNRWETDGKDPNKWSSTGQMRANHMESNMSQWIANLISNGL